MRFGKTPLDVLERYLRLCVAVERRVRQQFAKWEAQRKILYPRVIEVFDRRSIEVATHPLACRIDPSEPDCVTVKGAGGEVGVVDLRERFSCSLCATMQDWIPCLHRLAAKDAVRAAARATPRDGTAGGEEPESIGALQIAAMELMADNSVSAEAKRSLLEFAKEVVRTGGDSAAPGDVEALRAAVRHAREQRHKRGEADARSATPGSWFAVRCRADPNFFAHEFGEKLRLSRAYGVLHELKSTTVPCVRNAQEGCSVLVPAAPPRGRGRPSKNKRHKSRGEDRGGARSGGRRRQGASSAQAFAAATEQEAGDVSAPGVEHAEPEPVAPPAPAPAAEDDVEAAQPKRQRTCRRCHQPGHYAKTCQASLPEE